MANIKSQKKRNRQTLKRAERNKAVRTELKTRSKNVRQKVAAGEDATDDIRIAQKRFAKAGEKSIIHKNQAARRTSRLMRAAAKANSAS